MTPFHFCFLFSILLILSSAHKEAEKNDYHIYELIEEAQALGHQNLFELFGLKEKDASPEKVTHAFRRISVLEHPDKYRNKPKEEAKRASKLYGLLTSAADLLRSPEGRARYNWIVNEAPPWHKSTVYATRKFVQITAKHSLKESLLLLLIVFVISDYLMRILYWFVSWLQRWGSRRQVQEFGLKEKKRMMRKMERSTSPNLLQNVDSNFDALSRSQAPLQPFPRPWSILLISTPISIAHYIFVFCSTKLKRN
jgi:hypothetical protein